jgi:hypothetical protein
MLPSADAPRPDIHPGWAEPNRSYYRLSPDVQLRICPCRTLSSRSEAVANQRMRALELQREGPDGGRSGWPAIQKCAWYYPKVMQGGRRAWKMRMKPGQRTHSVISYGSWSQGGPRNVARMQDTGEKPGGIRVHCRQRRQRGPKGGTAATCEAVDDGLSTMHVAVQSRAALRRLSLTPAATCLASVNYYRDERASPFRFTKLLRVALPWRWLAPPDADEWPSGGPLLRAEGGCVPMCGAIAAFYRGDTAWWALNPGLRAMRCR